MKGKIAFILGASVGYVLGSRAGRERYEQIKQGANKLWNTAPVQNGVGKLQECVADKVATVQGFVVGKGKELLHAATKPEVVEAEAEKPAPAKPTAKKSTTAKKTGTAKSSAAKSSTAKKNGSKN